MKRNKLSDAEISQRQIKAKHDYSVRVVQGINLLMKLDELAEAHPAIDDNLNKIILNHMTASERRKLLFHLYGKNGKTRKEVKTLLRAYGVKLKKDGTLII